MFNSVDCALPEGEATPEYSSDNKNEADNEEFYLMVDELLHQFVLRK